MSYTIGYRMPMRDRPRVRVRLAMVLNAGQIGYTEASERAMERIRSLPDGTVVEAVQTLTVDDPGRGGDTRADPVPSEASTVLVVWNRGLSMAFPVGSGASPEPLSPSDVAYPSEDGGMSFVLPSNDALNVLVEADEDDAGWAEDEAIRSLPDGSVVECLLVDGGAVVDRSFGLMYGRELAVLVGSAGGMDI